MTEERLPDQRPIRPARVELPPVLLQQVEFRRAMRGYDPDQVSGLFGQMRLGYEAMWRDRLDLQILVRDLEAELAQHTDEQDMIRDVLIGARRSAEETEANARREADRILEEATGRAEQVLSDVRERAEEIMHTASARAAELVRGATVDLADRQERVRQLENLDREMRAGYRAFLVAALELLEGHAARAASLADEAGSDGAVSAGEPDDSDRVEAPSGEGPVAAAPSPGEGHDGAGGDENGQSQAAPSEVRAAAR